MSEAKQEAEKKIKINVKPQGIRVLVKEAVLSETPGGIILSSEGVKDANDLTRGTICDVGPWVNVERDGLPAPSFGQGDVVCYGPYAGIRVKIKEDPEGVYKLLPVADILATIED